MSDHVDSQLLPPCSFLRATRSERKAIVCKSVSQKKNKRLLAVYRPCQLSFNIFPVGSRNFFLILWVVGYIFRRLSLVS